MALNGQENAIKLLDIVKYDLSYAQIKLNSLFDLRTCSDNRL